MPNDVEPHSSAPRAAIAVVAAVAIAISTATVTGAASAQTIAGAEPPPPPAATPKKTRAVTHPAPAIPAPTPAPDVAPAPVAPPAPAPAPAPTTTVNVVSASTLACIPDCRAGWVCREGECVSACNPVCGEGETCNVKRECVARNESSASDPYPYDKTRFGVGGMFGVNSSSDGVGTPFGGLVGISVPLGSHWYSREDVVATYAKTSTEDHDYVGATVSPVGTATVDQSYLLIALRATAGYQFSQVISGRIGLIAGSHTLHTEHGFCGTGFAEKDDTSVAIGGTGALGFALKHADLSAVVDAYSADTQMLCSVSVSPLGTATGTPATLVPQRQFAAQFLAQATFLF